MKLKALGAASLAAIALVSCAKKETATSEVPAAVDETVVSDEASDAVAEAADVYAAPAAFDLATLRTKDALTAAADAAFAQSDADADGSLSQIEFYALAALMTPEIVAETAVEPVSEVAVDVFAEGAVAPAAEIAADAAESVLSEEPSADSTSLDASFASIAGADANLTSDDLRAAILARFDAADVNLDGTLDEVESAAFTAAQLF